MFLYIVLAFIIFFAAYIKFVAKEEEKKYWFNWIRDKNHRLYSRYIALKRKHIDIIPEAVRVGECLRIPYSINSAVYYDYIKLSPILRRRMIGVSVIAKSNTIHNPGYINITQQNGVPYMMSPKSLGCDIIQFIKDGKVLKELKDEEILNELDLKQE